MRSSRPSIRTDLALSISTSCVGGWASTAVAVRVYRGRVPPLPMLCPSRHAPSRTALFTTLLTPQQVHAWPRPAPAHPTHRPHVLPPAPPRVPPRPHPHQRLCPQPCPAPQDPHPHPCPQRHHILLHQASAAALMIPCKCTCTCTAGPTAALRRVVLAASTPPCGAAFPFATQKQPSPRARLLQYCVPRRTCRSYWRSSTRRPFARGDQQWH